MIRDDEKNRRDFLKNLALAGGAIAAAPAIAAADNGGGSGSTGAIKAEAVAPCAPATLPSSAEVSAAAYDSVETYRLVQTYRLTAMDLAELVDNLPVKPVPW
jgi:hypothetical protein